MKNKKTMMFCLKNLLTELSGLSGVLDCIHMCEEQGMQPETITNALAGAYEFACMIRDELFQITRDDELWGD